jgi:hypothetical protein
MHSTSISYVTFEPSIQIDGLYTLRCSCCTLNVFVRCKLRRQFVLSWQVLIAGLSAIHSKFKEDEINSLHKHDAEPCMHAYM